MLERQIQKKVVSYAKGKGALAYKFASESMRSVPDYLFLYSGLIVFIEFKAPGKRPTKAQQRNHKILEAAGFTVGVVDQVQQGKDFLDMILFNEYPEL